MLIACNWKFVAPALAAAMLLGSIATGVLAAELSPADKQAYEKAVQSAIAFLAANQNANGAFGTEAVEPGITAVVLAGVLRNGRGPDDPMVAKGLKYIESFIQPDGGIYEPRARQKNYITSLAMVALHEANADGRYKDVLAKADKFLKGLQFPEGDTRPTTDPSYGGVGYAGPERPDLSNTQFLMDALQAAGNGPDDEAVKRALMFVSRCQNLETEFNTTEWAAKVNDGGFYYAPGRSQAGNTDNGGLRSYGSMTYAGLKSMIFAGLSKDDPRVKASVEWLRKNYTLKENPGLGERGLYYYYCMYSKALAALGEDNFKDAAGTAHNWRSELISELAKRQQANGSWVNSNNQWMEGDPKLVTGYALLALSYVK